MDDNTLGVFLAEFRTQNTWTQKFLAQYLRDEYGIHCTTAMISSYETDRVVPAIHILTAYVDLFDIPVSVITSKLGWLSAERADWMLIPKDQHEAMQALFATMTPKEKGNEQEGLHSDSERPAADGSE